MVRDTASALPPRVFISSVQVGYDDIRNAAARGVQHGGAVSIRAEDFPAATVSPRTACLDGVASCDALLLILGTRYGTPTSVGISAVEEEYSEAKRLKKAILVFIERTGHEARQERFIQSVSSYVHGHWRKAFSSAEELESLVQQAIQEMEPMTGTSSDQAARERINAAFTARPPKENSVVWVQTVWATLRDEEVIDPIRFADRGFVNQVYALAHADSVKLFDYSLGKQLQTEATHLHISQSDSANWRQGRDLVELDLRENGTLSIALNVTGVSAAKYPSHGFGEMFTIDPEMVNWRLGQAWSFANRWWNFIDPYARHEPLLHNCELIDVGSRRLEKPRPEQTSYTLPAYNLESPLVVYDHARRMSRADLQAPMTSVQHALTMIQMRFQGLERPH